jgi:hypothetical protein
MERNYNKKHKILNIWNNMLELIALEEKNTQKLDSLTESLKILTRKINSLER